MNYAEATIFHWKNFELNEMKVHTCEENCFLLKKKTHLCKRAIFEADTIMYFGCRCQVVHQIIKIFSYKTVFLLQLALHFL